MSTVLNLETVSRRYGNGRGVREVSLDIAAGEIYGLIGPNGAGKTTLLKIIVGLLRPDAGTVRLFGFSLAYGFEQAMARVGSLIETADAYEYMNARDNLKLAARFYPDLPKTRIDEALEQVGLAAYRHEKVRGYSLGMKQRLGLASALLANPQFVVLDEPANGLDAPGMAELRQTILQLSRERGVAFLISSHLIHDLGMIADRVGIMKDGLMICQGAVRELLTDGQSLEHYALAQIRGQEEAEVHA